MTDAAASPPLPKRRRLRWSAVFVLLASVLLLANYATQTDWVPQIVDAVRNLPFVGPDRVAAMENFFYTAEDTWNQFIYAHTHAPIIVAGSDANSNDSKAPTPNAPSLGIDPTSGNASSPYATPGPGAPITSITAIVYKPPSPLTPMILSDPQVGEGVWTTRNMPLWDQPKPPLWHTFYRPDPDRPYARVDLVWIDLGQTELTLVQGTVEPRPTDGIKGTGEIPLAVQEGGKLLAAWNGGFLTLHGAYGMMINRRIIAPPLEGFAVLAQYSDGRVRLGVWGRDIVMTPDLMSFRQNGPILVDRGVVNQDPSLRWGKSVSGETRIWRSGIGVTASGELIYAIGDSLSAQTLGEALRQAGATEAMELDVNAWHAFFFTYALTSAGLVPTKLNAAIPGSLQAYLKPYDRDFMYLTLK